MESKQETLEMEFSRRKMNYPSIDNFFLAIGQDSDSAPLQAVFSSLGIGVSCLEKYPMNLEGLRIWSNLDASLQLEFKDIGLIRDIPHHDIDEGPWVLTDVIFWGWQKETNSSYEGPLPCGLNFSMSRESVREIVSRDLGQPQVFGFSENVDMWMLGAIEMTVDFDGERGIRCISLDMPEEE
ncbi:TPA: hypothetical protein NIA41_000499 [Pseudomonas aeruginosa]|nr:hypothetical protein [Pseudomonas aeruginosa]